MGNFPYEVLKAEAVESAIIDRDTIWVDLQNVLAVNKVLPAYGGIIIPDWGERDDSIRLMNDLFCPRIADFVPVNALESRMLCREEAFASTYNRNAAPKAISEFYCVFKRLDCRKLAADKNDDSIPFFEEAETFIHSFIQAFQIWRRMGAK